MGIQRKFARIALADSRDRAFALTPPQSGLPPQKHWQPGRTLDQRDTPHCVEFAGRQWLGAEPVRNRWPLPSGELYKLCQQNDDILGEDYEGTTVRGLFRVFRQYGFITSYRWAFDHETVANWILSTGPIVYGTDWYSGMMEPDADGFIHATGEVLGGHAYLLKGTDRTKRCPDGSIGADRICNSWGMCWGRYGYAWISYKDSARLLESDGEACTAIEAQK